MVAACQERGPRGRAERRGVEAVEPKAILCDTIEREGGNRPAERAAGPKSDIIRQDQQHVGRALGRLDRLRKILHGVGGTESNPPFEIPNTDIKHPKPKLVKSETAEQPVMEFPLVTKNRARDGPELYPVYQRDVDQWQDSYPAIDVFQELRACRQWNIDNERNRKTKNGIRRHINAWLQKEQNRARAYGGSTASF